MNKIIPYLFLISLNCGVAGAQTPAGAANATAATPSPAGLAMASGLRLNPLPAPGAAALPDAAGRLLSGYVQQAQGGLILVYFAAGTLGDALTAGAVSSADGRRQGGSYQALATSARDDLRAVRNAYTLNTADLDQLDKLTAAYGDVLPMIDADLKLADGPTDPANRATFQAARRKAFATLAALFDWK